MKKITIIFLLLISHLGYSQKDSLNLGDKYLEDQLYIGVTYNVLYNQPINVSSSGFSYGLSVGFIKDIPFNRKGNIAAGIGIGYGYDYFNQGLKVSNNNGKITFDIDNTLKSNKLNLHTIEIPLELRWRTSTATKYNFWRIYAGIKWSYNFSNTFSYTAEKNTFTFNNISEYNKWQYGLTLSAGYGAFSFYMYYGLTPLFKNASIKNMAISSKKMKLGLIFYIL